MSKIFDQQMAIINNERPFSKWLKRDMAIRSLITIRKRKARNKLIGSQNRWGKFHFGTGIDSPDSD